uniref:Uncharacterized protein n=1 Tax=Rhizophora mucronata TaxID=61149 RepID=A0A2P2IJA4_RHIMU
MRNKVKSDLVCSRKRSQILQVVLS